MTVRSIGMPPDSTNVEELAILRYRSVHEIGIHISVTYQSIVGRDTSQLLLILKKVIVLLPRGPDLLEKE